MARTGRPPRVTKITRVCRVCGGEWQAYPWDANRLLYCSRKCWAISRIGNVPGNKVEPEKRNCKWCGTEFLVGGQGRRHRSSTYCSKTCSKHSHWAQGKAPHGKARQMSEIECAWFAGFFDGEGCVGWPRRHLVTSFRLMISNTNREVLDRILLITGTGSIKERFRRSQGHSPAWAWTCNGDNARAILSQIFQHLIVKREAAEVALGMKKADAPPWTQRTKTMRAARGISSE